MKTSLQFTSSIHRISYIYHPLGDVEPVIHVVPPDNLLYDSPLTKYRWHQFSNTDILKDLSIGDMVKINIPADISKTSTCDIEIVSKTDNIPVDILSKYCPICGIQLRTPRINESIGRCINMTCPSMMVPTIIHFVASVGMVFKDDNHKIFDMLLSRGAIYTPVQLFSLTESDIVAYQMPRASVHSFIQYIHSFRGKVSLKQFLYAMRLPGLTLEKIDIIDQWFSSGVVEFPDIKNQYTGTYPDNIIYARTLLSVDIRQKIDIDWSDIDDFFSIEANVEQYSLLCDILLH